MTATQVPDYIRAYQLVNARAEGYWAPELGSPLWEKQVLDGLERQRISVKFDFSMEANVNVTLEGRRHSVEFNSGHRAEALCAAILKYFEEKP